MIKLPIIKSIVNLEANATAYFEVPDGTFTTEEITLNKIPNYTEAAIEVWLTEIGDRFSGDNEPGLNLTERRVRGYFLTQSLPSNIRASDRVRIVMKTSSGTEEARLFFTERFSPLKDTIKQTHGIPFEGFVQVVGGGQ